MNSYLVRFAVVKQKYTNTTRMEFVNFTNHLPCNVKMNAVTLAEILRPEKKP